MIVINIKNQTSIILIIFILSIQFLIIKSIHLNDDDKNIFDEIKNKVNSMINDIKRIPDKINEIKGNIEFNLNNKINPIKNSMEKIYDFTVGQTICWKNSFKQFISKLKIISFNCPSPDHPFLKDLHDAILKVPGLNAIYLFLCELINEIDDFITKCEPIKSLQNVFDGLLDKLPIKEFYTKILSKLYNLNISILIKNKITSIFSENNSYSSLIQIQQIEDTSIPTLYPIHNTTTQNEIFKMARNSCSSHNINSLNSLQYHIYVLKSNLKHAQISLLSLAYINRKMSQNLFPPGPGKSITDKLIYNTIMGAKSKVLFKIFKLIIFIMEYLQIELDMSFVNLSGCILDIQNLNIRSIKNTQNIIIENQLKMNQTEQSYLNEINNNLLKIMSKLNITLI